MACSITARSCGSCCGSCAACARAGTGRSASAMASSPSSSHAVLVRQTPAQIVENVLARHLLALSGAPVPILKCAGGQATLGDDDAVADTEQLSIGEFDARALVAVIVERLDAGSHELPDRKSVV